MQITMTGKYQTRSGLPVRVICVDRKHKCYSVIALVLEADGTESKYAYTNYGSYFKDGEENTKDLIPIPEIKTHQEQVAELLAIANAATSREWFTGAPPTIGWYPAGFITRTSYLHQVAYWHGDRWSYFLDYYDEREHMANMLHNCHDVSKVKWTTPWWPEEWSQAYWEKQV